MTDSWYSKSSVNGQYVSCMKINGVPLLPPILSQECKEEMQYYKLLAQEVEKRIALLKPLVRDESDSDDMFKETIEYKLSYDIPKQDIDAGFNLNIDKITAISSELPVHELESKRAVTELDKDNPPPPKLVFDLSLSINKMGKSILDTVNKHCSPAAEVPEHDCDYEKIKSEENNVAEDISETVNFKLGIDNDLISHSFVEINGPPSLTGRSFHGSLVDIHKESARVLLGTSHLVRQRSYTVLKPSPQLLAHLEQVSASGIDIDSLSMSGSQSIIGSSKKRKSWDLENAKYKWSKMAKDLNKKHCLREGQSPTLITKPTPKPIFTRAQSVGPYKMRPIENIRTPNSEPARNTRKTRSPTRRAVVTTTKTTPVSLNSKYSTPQKASSMGPMTPTLTKTPQTPNKENVDPTTCVRELFERVKSQQQIQMQNLLEKQKKEQQMLRKVFEEQNTILLKQLKQVCPKSPLVIKEAWGNEELESTDEGPVSLSQIISVKSPDSYDMSSTLTDASKTPVRANNILKNSLGTSNSVKGKQSSSNKVISSETRTHTPTRNPNFSSPRRKIVYDSSSSEVEPEMMTDRTSDTMADLNVTFSSDDSKNGHFIKSNNKYVIGTNSPKSPKTGRVSKMKGVHKLPTPQEREAATKIVAHAKGYLTRRLMETEKVQSTVQTIRDALMCALQLHQDREGIRGADIDLHRRLIQQITAACYALHDTMVASTPAQRCSVIAADRARKLAKATRETPSPRARAQIHARSQDRMTQSFSGAISTSRKRPSVSPSMTQSNYETTINTKKEQLIRRSSFTSPRKRPWR